MGSAALMVWLWLVPAQADLPAPLPPPVTQPAEAPPADGPLDPTASPKEDTTQPPATPGEPLPQAAPAEAAPAEDKEVPLSRVAWIAAGGGSAGVLAVGAVTALLVAATTVGAAGLLFPAALDANFGVCFCLACGLAPAQLAVLLASGLMAPLVAAPAAYAATRVFGKRRVPLLPLVAAVAIPMAGGLILSTVLAAGCTLGNCFTTAFGSLCFTSFLVDRYDWPQQEAEYYAFRRAAPFIFYGCMGVSQLLLMAAMLGATGLTGAMAAWAATGTGRPGRADDPVTPDWISTPTETPEEL